MLQKLVFKSETAEIEFVDAGIGIAIMVPEWEGTALVLQAVDIARLELLIKSWMARRP